MARLQVTGGSKFGQIFEYYFRRLLMEKAYVIPPNNNTRISFYQSTALE